MEVKYIRTQNDEIVVFSHLIMHSDFKAFNPISAGFIGIHRHGDYTLKCTCYGESVSLGLRSLKEEDSKLATKQILGIGEDYLANKKV